MMETRESLMMGIKIPITKKNDPVINDHMIEGIITGILETMDAANWFYTP